MADVLKFNDEAIRKLFSQYIESCEDMERHSAESVRSAELFDDFCSRYVEGGMLKKIEAYVKMSDVAVEFEEDGFVAGFKVAMQLLLAQDQVSDNDILNYTDGAETNQHRAPDVSGKRSKVSDCFITSKQIAELFGTINWRVVKRIDNQIMPFLDNGSKALFEKASGLNSQNKPVVFYKLNQAACRMYLEIMYPKKAQFTNIAAGCAKLQKLMQKTFHTEAVALSV